VIRRTGESTGDARECGNDFLHALRLMRTADGSFKEIFLHYIKGEISRRKLTCHT
jgi:hypothetical protein